MKAATAWGARAVGLVLMMSALAGCGDASSGAGGDARQAPTTSGGRLVVTTDNGLRLRPADGDRVTVERGVGLNWSHRDDTWVLDLSCDGSCPRMPRVAVPDGTAVTVVARNAGIDAAGVSGALDLTTVNGDVTVADAGSGTATVRLATRNGSVRATRLRAGALAAETVNGDVVLGCATAPRRITAATVNGSASATLPHDAPAYRTDATTYNGRSSVTVPSDGAAADRTVRLSTVNGDVRAHRG
ncbi:DUF4097 family beta strand repeat protein [Streptomyces sp. SID8379]|uniref:DUF4097 family beta strand repeat-containing protein n=1 Tax=unclassified Streptomyces TaxID=2593676 RepID=UPI00037160AA|nr:MULTISPECIES: DUF4097 family beta strand repeat-containing protein [unclassified Streptomyces]MYW64276.1 DUF4097 family beta strand repeat protein [Streptomyces sp. SID8379]